MDGSAGETRKEASFTPQNKESVVTVDKHNGGNHAFSNNQYVVEEAISLNPNKSGITTVENKKKRTDPGLNLTNEMGRSTKL